MGRSGPVKNNQSDQGYSMTPKKSIGRTPRRNYNFEKRRRMNDITGAIHEDVIIQDCWGNESWGDCKMAVDELLELSENDQYSPEVRRVIAAVYFGLKQFNYEWVSLGMPSIPALAETIARLFRMSRTTMSQKIIQPVKRELRAAREGSAFKIHNELFSRKERKDFSRKLSTVHMIGIRQFIEDAASKGITVSTSTVRSFLACPPNSFSDDTLSGGQAFPSVVVCSTTVQKALKELGMIYQRIIVTHENKERPGVQLMLNKYLSATPPMDDQALDHPHCVMTAEGPKTYVWLNVFVDESYVNANSKLSFSWTPEKNNHVMGRTGAGHRFVFADMMTRYGRVPGAILLFKANSGKGDYHDSMNWEHFAEFMRNGIQAIGSWWVNDLKQRASEACGREVDFVRLRFRMDGAAYHTVKADSAIKIAQDQRTKSSIIQALISKAGDARSPEDLNRMPRALLLADLRKAHAHQESTAGSHLKIVALLNELSAFKDSPHVVWFTPPYCPETQPIEMMWGYVKRRVFMKLPLLRTAAEIKSCITEEFESVVPELTEKWVNHCRKWVSEKRLSRGLPIHIVFDESQPQRIGVELPGALEDEGFDGGGTDDVNNHLSPDT